MSVDFYAYRPLVHRKRSTRRPQFIDANLNLANGNAVMFLRWLNLDADPCNLVGSHDVQDLKARCLLALGVGGVFTDDGVATVESGGEGTGHCRWIDCGIPPGYFEARAKVLIEVCDQALAAGIKKVRWA